MIQTWQGQKLIIKKIIKIYFIKMHLFKIKCKLKGVKKYVTNVFMYFYSNQLFLYSTKPVYL